MRFLRDTLTSGLRRRELVWETTRRELAGQNQGSMLGLLWLVVAPLVQVGAYVVIISLVFRNRGGGANPFDYALYVLSGMVPWQLLTRSLQDAPSLLRDKMDLIKQVIYPIETLPLPRIALNAIGPLVALGIYLVLAAVTGNLHWTVVLLPVPAALLLLLCVGISWGLSIIGVVVKDLPNLIGLALSFLIYLSPVVLSETMVGPRVWSWILLNPLSHVVLCFRDVFGATFHPASWLIFAAMTLGSVVVGALLMQRSKLLINEYI